MSKSSQFNKMRFGGSQILSVALGLIILIVIYFYWSTSGQLRSAKHDVESLKEKVKILEYDKERLANRVTVLTEDMKIENNLKREIEKGSRNLKVQLDEAQIKLVRKGGVVVLYRPAHLQYNYIATARLL